MSNPNYLHTARRRGDISTAQHQRAVGERLRTYFSNVEWKCRKPMILKLVRACYVLRNQICDQQDITETFEKPPILKITRDQYQLFKPRFVYLPKPAPIIIQWISRTFYFFFPPTKTIVTPGAQSWVRCFKKLFREILYVGARNMYK